LITCAWNLELQVIAQRTQIYVQSFFAFDIKVYYHTSLIFIVVLSRNKHNERILF